MDPSDKRVDVRGKLLERLRDPIQLRVVIAGLSFLAGYMAIYLPLSSEIASTTAGLARERRRLELAHDIEHLRAQFGRIQKHLSEKPDPNEWVQYVLKGIRGFPVQLVTLDTDPVREVGPYKAVVLRIELAGAFQDLNALVRWLETNERLFRIDSVKVAPHRKENGVLVMQLTVLGLMG